MTIEIDGKWLQVGAALNQDGSTLYDWEARLMIVCDSNEVRVTVAAEKSKSRSVSRVATLEPTSDGRITLLYEYVADPTHEGSVTHGFFGMTRIAFDTEAQRGEGNYLNYNGRYTFGRLSLTRP